MKWKRDTPIHVAIAIAAAVDWNAVTVAVGSPDSSSHVRESLSLLTMNSLILITLLATLSRIID
jgi:hypothetical protein